jgi:hypothetical protein
MSTVGIMHSGSNDTAKKYIEILKTHLQTFTIDGPNYPTLKDSLRDIADYFIQKKKGRLTHSSRWLPICHSSNRSNGKSG